MKAIYTDEWVACTDIATEGTKHKAARYRGGTYAMGKIHRRIPKDASSDAGLLAWQVFRVI